MNLTYVYLVAFGISLLSLIAYFEFLFVIKPDVSVGIKNTLLASLVLPFILVVLTLISSVGSTFGILPIFVYVLYLIPTSLLAGLVLGVFYGLRNGPIGRTGNLSLLAISLACIVTMYSYQKHPTVIEPPSQLTSPATSENIYTARKYLDYLSKTGLIKREHADGTANVVVIDGELWKSKTRGEKEGYLRNIGRSYDILLDAVHATSRVTLKDYHSGTVCGVYEAPSKLEVY